MFQFIINLITIKFEYLFFTNVYFIEQCIFNLINYKLLYPQISSPDILRIFTN